MWQNRRSVAQSSQEVQEDERTPIPLSSSTPRVPRIPRIPHIHNNNNFNDGGNESDEEAFHAANANVRLLFSPLEPLQTYAAVQRSSTMRPPCDCTEELPMENCLPPPTSYSTIYYQRPLSTPSDTVRSSDSDDSIRMNHNISNISSVSDEVSTNATMDNTGSPVSLADVGYVESPIAVPKHKNNNYKNLVRRRLITTPEPPLERRRLSTLHRMPRPSTTGLRIANRIIKYACCIKNRHEKHMWCVNCGLLPTNPVTGQCGHTMCSKCISVDSECLCGDDFPESLNVNILIRDLIEKLIRDGPSARSNDSLSSTNTANGPEFTTSGTADYSKESDTSDDERKDPISSIPDVFAVESDSTMSITFDGPDETYAETQFQPAGESSASCSGRLALETMARDKRPIPMSPRARYNHAVQLLLVGRHLDAAPHFALVAASDHSDFRHARKLLTQVITLLSKSRDAKGLTVELKRSVRRLSSTSWLKQSDLECILCRDVFNYPVTTPCGHMFCRTCLERTLDYKRRCPLCLHSLRQFNLSNTANTFFVEGALKSINAVVTPAPLEPDLIPIFVCTVAFPSVPCPLIIFDPRYWLMIRRVLESGSRKFGMVASGRGQDYVGYGTILEVRDCVQLEDGRSILSTVGLSRFKVIERSVRDGCDVARILPIVDVIPVENLWLWDIKMLGRQIIFKALAWLSGLDISVLNDIEVAFGRMPLDGASADEWRSPDGPAWLWWLIAVLPLRSEIKVLILCTNSLFKRMLAVGRTLEAIEQHRAPTSPHRSWTSSPHERDSPTRPRYRNVFS